MVDRRNKKKDRSNGETVEQNDRSFLSWTVGGKDGVPKEFGGHSPISSTLIPRTVGWISVTGGTAGDNGDEEANENGIVALLEGFTAAAYTPPTLYFAASALPQSVLDQLLATEKCTVSAVTARESEATIQAAATAATDHDGTARAAAFSFDALGLTAAAKRHDYPRAVASSPIHMYCTLRESVEFPGTDDRMIVLTVETFVVDGSVLSRPAEGMRATVTAKIDAELIRPRVGLGNRRQYPLLAGMRSMPRPQQQPDGTWTSTEFDIPVESCTETTTQSLAGEFEAAAATPMEWNFRTDGRSCALGFNPVTALVMPRPIGWISTYSSADNGRRVEHLAPYSFFIDVARDERHPMVGFSAYRRDGTIRKDAHKDAEETGAFCFNLVNESLAVPMNYSAAELPREESEFALAGLSSRKAELVGAPCVRDAHVVYECEYVKTVDVESFSIVIGAVKRVTVDRKVFSADGGVDVQKLRPIARMGYTDEYGFL